MLSDGLGFRCEECGNEYDSESSNQGRKDIIKKLKGMKVSGFFKRMTHDMVCRGGGCRGRLVGKYRGLEDGAAGRRFIYDHPEHLIM